MPRKVAERQARVEDDCAAVRVETTAWLRASIDGWGYADGTGPPVAANARLNQLRAADTDEAAAGKLRVTDLIFGRCTS